MKKLRREIYFRKPIMLLNAAFTMLLLSGAFGFVWETFYNDSIIDGGNSYFFKRGNIIFYGIYFIILFTFFALTKSYALGDKRASDLTYSQLIGIIGSDAIAYFQICLFARKIVSPFPMLVLVLSSVLFLGIWNSVATSLIKMLHPPKKTIVVYGGRAASILTMKMAMRTDMYIITAAINTAEGTEAVLDAIKNFEAVVICDTPNEIRNDVLKFCYQNRIVTYTTPKISDILLRGAENLHTFDTPLLMCRNFCLKLEQRMVKRFFDIVLSVIGIIVASPFMLLVAAAIKLDDGGKVLFKQQRFTVGRKIFTLYKFRSMIENAEKDGIARLSEKGDSRITRVGKFIRKTRLDELPQLFNIFIGDMSFVGPRPERPEIALQYEDEMPEFAFRLSCKAGLTGYAQVMGKYNTTPYDKLKLDLMYIQQYSLMLDFMMIIRTVQTVFTPDATEGIEEGSLTASIGTGSGGNFASENAKQIYEHSREAAKEKVKQHS